MTQRRPALRNLDDIRVGEKCLTDCNQLQRVRWLKQQDKDTLVVVADRLATLLREFGEVYDVEG